MYNFINGDFEIDFDVPVGLKELMDIAEKANA